jgi:hypothetical protein
MAWVTFFFFFFVWAVPRVMVACGCLGINQQRLAVVGA